MRENQRVTPLDFFRFKASYCPRHSKSSRARFLQMHLKPLLMVGTADPLFVSTLPSQKNLFLTTMLVNGTMLLVIVIR